MCVKGGSRDCVKKEEVDGSTSMYSGKHVHECEWDLHTSTVLFHMLSRIVCMVDLLRFCRRRYV